VHRDILGQAIYDEVKYVRRFSPSVRLMSDTTLAVRVVALAQGLSPRQAIKEIIRIRDIDDLCGDLTNKKFIKRIVDAQKSVGQRFDENDPGLLWMQDIEEALAPFNFELSFYWSASLQKVSISAFRRDYNGEIINLKHEKFAASEKWTLKLFPYFFKNDQEIGLYDCLRAGRESHRTNCGAFYVGNFSEGDWAKFVYQAYLRGTMFNLQTASLLQRYDLGCAKHSDSDRISMLKLPRGYWKLHSFYLNEAGFTHELNGTSLSLIGA
jgi:hypothetical protein